MPAWLRVQSQEKDTRDDMELCNNSMCLFASFYELILPCAKHFQYRIECKRLTNILYHNSVIYSVLSVEWLFDMIINKSMIKRVNNQIDNKGKNLSHVFDYIVSR